MPKKKTDQESKPATPPDRHKPSHQVRVPQAFADRLQELADLKGTKVSEEVRAAIREYLQKHSLWPKSPGH